MVSASKQEVSQLLRAWSQGDKDALDRLYELVYDELRHMAHRYMSRENPGHTMQTTALVNEAYLRLASSKDLDWKDRAHFFAVSANVMRRILIDNARARRAERRGGDDLKVAIDEALEIEQKSDPDLIALDDALNELAKVNERHSKVVELRYFGGLSVEETATVLAVSEDTVMRDWRFAKAWLRREMVRTK
ncbi:MAG: sigma-70 family RNA polymerase sigma factor [Acidobacteria bacterium]|nr:sigma-70 family RNA polymerase sigma factor [Acidobacteriota bacterium]MCI0664625.1 sigma-70 family RNA polymerase sigma factor [Acidobacteriota bacterium]